MASRNTESASNNDSEASDSISSLFIGAIWVNFCHFKTFWALTASILSGKLQINSKYRPWKTLSSLGICHRACTWSEETNSKTNLCHHAFY